MVGTERQRTVEFREMTCVHCNVIDEHRIEKFHNDGYARIQCGVCQFDRKELLRHVEAVTDRPNGGER